MLEIIATIGVGMVPVIGALIHLYSKVNVQERAQQDLREFIGAKFEGLRDQVEAKFDGVNYRLIRIERSMNGHLIKD